MASEIPEVARDLSDTGDKWGGADFSFPKVFLLVNFSLGRARKHCAF
jgi:hypothetical protein